MLRIGFAGFKLYGIQMLIKDKDNPYEKNKLLYNN